MKTLNRFIILTVILALTGCSAGGDGASTTQTTGQSPQGGSPSDPVNPGDPNKPVDPIIPVDPIVLPTTADAGPDQTVRVGVLVSLNGQGTNINPVQSLTITWTFVTRPGGSQAVFKDANTLNPSFTPDVAGQYVISLVINDSVPDLLLIDAQGKLVTLRFNGTFGVDGQVTGTFTYDSTLAPIAKNVKGLQPNAMYPVIAWSLEASGGGMPYNTYSNTNPNNSIELCVGICFLSPTQVIQLIFHNASNLIVQLTFNSNDGSPFTDPPVSLTEWGPMLQSVYRAGCLGCVPVVVLQTGVLTAVSN